MARKILSIMLVLALAVTSVFCLGTGPVPAAAAAEDPYVVEKLINQNGFIVIYCY